MSPPWGDFGQELFYETCYAFVILKTKGENWDGTDFKIEVGRKKFLVYTEWTLPLLRLLCVTV